MPSVSLVLWRGNGLGIAYSFFEMGRARVADGTPGERNAFVHHLPVSLSTVDYAYEPFFHCSET